MITGGGSEAGVEVHDAKTGLGRCDRQLDEVAVIAARDAEAFTAACPEVVQPLGELSRLAIQVRVGQAARFVDDRRAVR